MIVKKQFHAWGWQCANPTIRGVTARRMFRSDREAAADAARTLPVGEPYNVFQYELSDAAASSMYGAYAV